MQDTSKNSLFYSFLRDSEGFIKQLNKSLLALEQDPKDRSLINTLFRNAHSLKSEADYLNQSEIAAEAHQIENEIQKLRDSSDSPSPSQFDLFFSSVDRVQEMLSQLKQHTAHSTLQGSAETPVSAEKETGSKGENSSSGDVHKGLLYRGSGERSGVETHTTSDTELLFPKLSNFEKSLVRESRIREERFFRIHIELSETTELPYAKAYLILSNLEQLVQVVRSEPEFGAGVDTGNPKRYLHLLFLCTGNISENVLYRAVNIDQVQEINIAQLDYKSVLGENVQQEEPAEFSSELQVHIDGHDLDELNGYVDELKIRTHRLERELAPKNGPVPQNISLLTKIVDDLEAFTHRISLVKLEDALQPHYRLVRDHARALDKEVELHLDRCDITLDRRAAELISDILVHLVRNAVTHGIEMPVERAHKGKDATGNITIIAEKFEESIRITVHDDGAGIDKTELMQRAQEAGIDSTDIDTSEFENELLAYLVYPGLSTLPEADQQAGRGYGLDLVYQKLKDFEGGELEVYSEADAGTSFVITFPSGFSILSLQVVRYENSLVAVPAKYVESEVEIEEGTFSAGENGELLWNELTVFSPQGQLFYTDSRPPQQQGIIVSYLKHKVIVLVNEVLFKKEVAEESITLYIAGSPHLHKMSLYNAESELYYLSPSIAASGISQ